jgi:flagellar basal-body rod protein FlgF
VSSLGINFAYPWSMYKGIYIALSGAVLKNTQMEVISQNLANADTIGYKKDKITFKDYLMPQDAFSGSPDGRAMSDISKFMTDLSAGNMIRTGNALDIAIEGKGFISLEGNRYTRRGDLKKDNEGYLTTQNNIKVLGKKGPIQLPDGALQINESGEVFVNEEMIDSLKIVDFQQTENLTKAGEDIFFYKGNPSQIKGFVKQGNLEKSNVEIVKEMVNMIEMYREFESFQKAIQFFDEAQEKATNEIAKI